MTKLDIIRDQKLAAEEAQQRSAESRLNSDTIRDDAKKSYAIISAIMKFHKVDSNLNEHEANQGSSVNITDKSYLVIKPSFHFGHDPKLSLKENSKKRIMAIKEILDIARISNKIADDTGNNGYALHVDLSNENREQLKRLAKDYGIEVNRGVGRG